MRSAWPFTVSESNGSAEPISMMMDFDGYLDIFAGGVIQYTNHLGGISTDRCFRNAMAGTCNAESVDEETLL